MLVSACALTAVMVGPTSASADTLTLIDAAGNPAEFADFASPSTIIRASSGGIYACDGIALSTEVTQNGADPVTLQLPSPPSTAVIGSCPTPTGTVIEYSNVELTGPMEFSADGTGTLPLRFTETWKGINVYSCVREGVLDLTYDPNESVNQQIPYSGTLSVNSGVCPTSAHWEGTFYAPTDVFGVPLEWIVTP